MLSLGGNRPKVTHQPSKEAVEKVTSRRISITTFMFCLGQ